MINKRMLTDARLIPKHSPKTALVILHGFGDDGQGILGIAPPLLEKLPADMAQHMAVFAPDGPQPTPFAMGRQWFSDKDFTFRDKPGIDAAKNLLEAHIAQEVVEKQGIPWEKIVLAGFSQGMMTALYAAPRFKEKVAGIVGLSGRLLWAEELKEDTYHTPPVLLCHGTADDVVPADDMVKAAKTMSNLGFDVDHHLIDGLGHGVDETVMGHVRGFLKKLS